tara:strand:+ start:2797 stop:3378 length:582 start_codon:yes stop_codon:yes gene_type:complete
MLYLKRCDKKLEKFDGSRRKYTLKELACALQAIKTFLGKDEKDQIYLIEVKDVSFVGDTATIVCVAFNKKTFTTKMYKAVIEKDIVISMTDNMIQFDETYMEHQKFGGPRGIHDSEQLKNIPFITGDVAKLSRYTFSKEIPKWSVDETIDLGSSEFKESMGKGGTKDINIQMAQIVANPEMRKYVTIQSLRGF